VTGTRELGVRFATTLDLVDRGPDTVINELVPIADAIYLSVDLDVLDLSVAPGTTLSEPGGLSYRELRATLTAIARRSPVVAIDVAALNPPADNSGTTARVACWLITYLLSELFANPWSGGGGGDGLAAETRNPRIARLCGAASRRLLPKFAGSGSGR
jgi:arginase family enzyme